MRESEWNSSVFPLDDKIKIYTLVGDLVQEIDQGEFLSGGEQQMLAIARTLMGNPDLLLLDEPSQGLAPKIVREVMSIILELKQKGISILLVEQNSVMALAVSERCYILDDGRIVHESASRDLDANKDLKKDLLGI